MSKAYPDAAVNLTHRCLFACVKSTEVGNDVDQAFDAVAAASVPKFPDKNSTVPIPAQGVANAPAVRSGSCDQTGALCSEVDCATTAFPPVL